MGKPPSDRLLLGASVVVGALLAAGAVFLTSNPVAPSGPELEPFFTVAIALALFLWALLSVVARLIIVGRLPKSRAYSLPRLIWGGSRFAFLIGSLILLAGWLVSLALGLQVQSRFLDAGVFLIVWMGITGFFGGAMLNSLLVLRELRSRRG